MTDNLASSRVILYYNGAISALTLFAQHPGGSICAPCPLPALASVLEANEEIRNTVSTHPAGIVSAIAKLMALPAHLLKATAGYHEQVDVPHGLITVYLARFDLLDPPHQLLADKGCQLKTLTQLRGQPPAEMELLRRAYALVMES
ncbi:MAG: hypothetical protein Q7U57_17130 [Methylovulum sp.]|nr:hypothetical protein [Methylovulum sp.]